MAISSGLGSSALLPAGLGFRNAIINGDFRINQRGFSSATADGTYGFDRWTMLTSGGTTYSAQTFSTGNAIPGYEPTNFARLVTSGQSASSTYSIFTQKIEGVRNCAGQQITISFWAKAASGTPKVSIELAQVFGTGGSASVDTYINQVTLSTSWTRYTVSCTVPSISGKTVGSANDYFGLTLWVSAGSNFNARTGSLGIQSNTFDFWGVQLEANSQPTPFEQRPIGVELALCQRYYTSMTDPPFRGVFNGSTSIARLGGVLPVRMRVAPIVTITGTLNIYNSSTTGTITSVGAYNSTVDGVEIDTSAATGTFGSGQMCVLYIFGGSGKVNCNSEL